MFKKELEKTGKEPLQCQTKRKKTFFNMIDKKYKKESEAKYYNDCPKTTCRY